VARVSGLLDWRGNQALFVMPPWHYPESIKARVIALRDEYERIFVRLIDDLPLRSDIDKHLRSLIKEIMLTPQDGILAIDVRGDLGIAI
jgi:hypothetical protein